MSRKTASGLYYSETAFFHLQLSGSYLRAAIVSRDLSFEFDKRKSCLVALGSGVSKLAWRA